MSFMIMFSIESREIIKIKRFLIVNFKIMSGPFDVTLVPKNGWYKNLANLLDRET